MRRRHKVGDRVVAKQGHSGVPVGTQGRVKEVRQGVYYGVQYPGFADESIYSPQEHVGPLDQKIEPETPDDQVRRSQGRPVRRRRGPTGANSDDSHNSPATDELAWELLIEKTAGLGL